VNPAPAIISCSILATFIREKYGLSKVQCKLLVRGVGDTYLIGAGQGQFILRIYRSSHRNLLQINEETVLLTILKEAGISVSYPIADLTGNFVQIIHTNERECNCVLFSFAPGKAESSLNKSQLQSLGHEMARFHNVSSAIDIGNSRWNFDVETTLFSPLKVLEPYFNENHEDYNWLQYAVAKASVQLSKFDTSLFSKGYCHFDFLPKNFHFDGNNITFFDFDFYGYGWLANDVMTFWQHLCLDVHFGRMTQEAADEAYDIFLLAYQKYRPLNDTELAAVPYLSLGFWLFYMAFHTTHDQFQIYVEPGHLKLRINLIRELMDKYWQS
jgi:Ser/Thr protein kinase RdoA (MazF antagonist)